MSKSRKKGTAFETEIVGFLRKNGFKAASRSPLHGNRDQGDALNTEPFVIEMKNQRAVALGTWIDEAFKEWSNVIASNPKMQFPVVVHKRKGQGYAGHQFVTMDLMTFTRLAAHVKFAVDFTA